MKEEKRFNNGYRIIESHLAGEMEIVMGHNPPCPQPLCVLVLQKRYRIFDGVLWG